MHFPPFFTLFNVLCPGIMDEFINCCLVSPALFQNCCNNMKSGQQQLLPSISGPGLPLLWFLHKKKSKRAVCTFCKFLVPWIPGHGLRIFFHLAQYIPLFCRRTWNTVTVAADSSHQRLLHSICVLQPTVTFKLLNNKLFIPGLSGSLRSRLFNVLLPRNAKSLERYLYHFGLGLYMDRAKTFSSSEKRLPRLRYLLFFIWIDVNSVAALLIFSHTFVNAASSAIFSAVFMRSLKKRHLLIRISFFFNEEASLYINLALGESWPFHLTPTASNSLLGYVKKQIK